MENKNNFKYLSVDSQFIINKQMKNKYTGRNIQYKFKNGVRISAIVDINGIPLINSINKGSEHDSVCLINIMQQLFKLGISTIDFKNKKKSKITLLGDSAYDTKNIRNFLNENNMKGILRINNRNTKNKEKLRYLTKDEEKILNKRSKIENCHAWKETIVPRLGKIYDKNYINFEGAHNLSIISLILSRKLIAIKNII